MAGERTPNDNPHQRRDDNFVAHAVSQIPVWAMGMIGTMLGIAMAFFIVVKMGGLEHSLVRISEAYATKIEKSVLEPAAEMARVTNEMKMLAEKVRDNMEGLAERTEKVYTRLDVMEAELNRRAQEIREIDTRVRVIEGSHKIQSPPLR